MPSVDPQTAFHIQQAFADLAHASVTASVSRPPLTHESIAHDVQAVFRELDLRQLEITRHLSTAQRLRQVYEINRFFLHAAIAAIRQQHPGISEANLSRELLRRMGIRLVP